MQAKYVGKQGEYLADIPMRDLTEEDWSSLDADQRKLVRSSSIYEVQSTEKAEAPAKKEG
jgi:hypothetical protein